MSTQGGAPSPPPVDTGDGFALPAGYPVNEYVVERTLGGGGFGITYLAHDSNLALPVAIKEYFPADLASRGADYSVHVRSSEDDNVATYEWGLERFLDEARALATFRHPNIVRVLRYFRDNGTAYIVMEYESGVSLKRWVPQNSPMSGPAVLSMVRPLLDGLEQVHTAGFLHRDIKPDNIFVRANNTPVLLDFGSARRVSANQDMTNIVSPGFAPFEQYHSHGSQGPWTDIYSLGAVMYWMVTGKKPIESAARVKTDTMLPASKLANPLVFGHELLGAIDWALQPEEGKRPQSISALRRVLAPDDMTRPAVQRAPDRSAAAAQEQPGTPSHATAESASRKKTVLCTILFLDLVGYSVRSVDDQVAIKRLFNELTNKALRGVAPESRIAIDTGDGAAICFMGDPEEALHSALLLRDLLGQRYGGVLSLRTGLHMGPVRVVSDLNQRVNVIGDGINVAQRVMDFAQPNQVLVSRAYYDVISRITDDTADMFGYLGQYEDKHGRLHELYSVGTEKKNPTTQKQGPSTGYTQTVPAPGEPITDEEAAVVEAELARHIGPLSRVLVHKARPLAATVKELREALATAIQEPKAREMFLMPSSGKSDSRSAGARSTPLSKPISSPVSAPRSASSPRASAPAGPPPGASIPMQRTGFQPSIPFVKASGPSQPIASRPNPTRPVDVPVEDMTAMEQTLSKFIGPMARIVVKKEAGRSGSFKELVAALAGNVDNQDQRDAFIASLRKALPRRQF